MEQLYVWSAGTVYRPESDQWGRTDILMAMEFGDPGSGGNNTSSQPNPSHSFTIAGFHTVLLTVTNINSCTNTTSKVIEIFSLPVETLWPIQLAWIRYNIYGQFYTHRNNY